MVRGQINILARAPQHTANAPSAYEALALCATDCGPLSKIRPPMLFSVGSRKVLGPKMNIFFTRMQRCRWPTQSTQPSWGPQNFMYFHAYAFTGG